LKAPLVFAIVAVLLGLAWIWVATTEWSGQRQATEAARRPGAVTQTTPPAPSLPTVNRLLAMSATSATGNVFHAVTIDRFIERRAAQRKAEEEARRKAEAEAEALRKAKAAAAAAAEALRATTQGGAAAKPAVQGPPPKRYYAVTYHGLVTTPERQEVGIIGIMPPGTPPPKRLSVTVATGDACLGATVTQVSRDSVTIELKSGATVVLEAGKAERIEEPLLNAR
jgi:sRNA-binding protein